MSYRESLAQIRLALRESDDETYAKILDRVPSLVVEHLARQNGQWQSDPEVLKAAHLTAAVVWGQALNIMELKMDKFVAEAVSNFPDEKTALGNKKVQARAKFAREMIANLERQAPTGY